MRATSPSWFGLTPKEYSSGGTRHLGRISKRGDRYLRMLLTHGARAVLRAATAALHSGRRRSAAPLGARRAGANEPQQGHLCARQQAGRICYAGLRDGAPYGGVAPTRKIGRTALRCRLEPRC